LWQGIASQGIRAVPGPGKQNTKFLAGFFWSCFSWIETEAAADLHITVWAWGFNGVDKGFEHVALRRC